MTIAASTPLPSKNDPTRPLFLAVRSTRLLGAASMFCGLVVILAFGYFNTYTLYRKYFIGGGLVVWFVPGVLLLTCSFFLARRRRVAAVTGMLVAFAQGVCAATFFYFSVTLEPVSVVPVMLSALWLMAIVQLIHHLWQSLAAIRLDTAYRRGFDLAAPPLAVLHAEVGEEQPGGRV